MEAGADIQFIGLANYGNLFHDQRFLAAVARTFYFTFLAVAIEIVLGVAIALLLNRETRGKNLFNAIFLLPMMATPVAIAMGWLLIYEPTVGIANYILQILHLPGQQWVTSSGSSLPSLVLVDVWEWTPMVSLITLAGLAGLPGDPFEAARVDGATPWQVTWKITLPLLWPTITVAALLRLIDALKTFDTVYTMTGGGPDYSPETLNIYVYQQAFSYYSFGYASSILVIFFAIVNRSCLHPTHESVPDNHNERFDCAAEISRHHAIDGSAYTAKCIHALSTKLEKPGHSAFSSLYDSGSGLTRVDYRHGHNQSTREWY